MNQNFVIISIIHCLLNYEHNFRSSFQQWYQGDLFGDFITNIQYWHRMLRMHEKESSAYWGCNTSNQIPPSIGPIISGLEDLWHEQEWQDIACHVEYYQNDTLAFIWELIRRSGVVITFTDYIKQSQELWYGAKYIAALNYTVSTDDIQNVLRCTARVDGDTNGSYEANDEKHIPSYGMWLDKTLEHVNEIWNRCRHMMWFIH